MERDLVEERHWITSEEYKRGLALAQLVPGPLAAQLAIYIGYVKQKVLGETLIGIGFIPPSFLMVVTIGMLYVVYGGLEWVQAVFYGVDAAVIGIIVKSAHKLTKLTLKNNVLLWCIFIVMCVVTACTEEEIVWLFILSGVVALFVLSPPRIPSSPSINMLLPPLGISFFQMSSLPQSGLLIAYFSSLRKLAPLSLEADLPSFRFSMAVLSNNSTGSMSVNSLMALRLQ
jgi:chromate transporter